MYLAARKNEDRQEPMWDFMPDWILRIIDRPHKTESRSSRSIAIISALLRLAPHLRLVLSTFFLAALFPCSTIAQEHPHKLENITKVTTLVWLDPTGELPEGISEARLRAIIEQKLRSAGLRVLTESEYTSDPEIKPYVFLVVSTIQSRNHGGDIIGYAYRVDLSARVGAKIPFNRAFAPLEIWTTGALAESSKSPSKHIEKIVAELTDLFIKAWLEANPKNTQPN